MSRPDAKEVRPRWPLLEAGFASATKTKYKRAVHHFIDWCLTTGNDPHTTDDLDEALADYFQDIHEDKDGGGKSVAAAVCNRWHKSRPNVSYPPLTWELAVLIACQLARSGHYRYGVATLLGFDCLLRKGEMMSLRREDFADGKDVRLGSVYRQAMVAVKKAKTGRFQSVPIEDPSVRALLADVVRQTKPQRPGPPRLCVMVLHWGAAYGFTAAQPMTNRLLCACGGSRPGNLYSLVHAGVPYAPPQTAGRQRSWLWRCTGSAGDLAVARYEPKFQNFF
jgi:hypothetical protein